MNRIAEKESHAGGRSQPGGLQVYEILVRQHEKMLFAYLLGIVGDAELAEELAQEAFVQAYYRLNTLRDRGAFAPWLRTIARNLAFEELARRGREAPTEPEVIQGMEDVFLRFDSDELGDSWAERVKAVRDCFAKLPETLRRVCQLHYMEDLPTKIVAERLGASLASVLKRLERARDAIRRCVERALALEGPEPNPGT